MRLAASSLNELIGVPYVNRGRSMDGADCWGIVALFHEHILGQRLPDYLALYASADDAADATLAFALGRQAWIRVPPGARQAGDVALLRIRGYPCHCGVLTGDGHRFLHTLRGRMSCIESLEDVVWRDRVEGVWRWAS